jgi:flagellar biosynthesis protein FlhF
MNIKRYVAATTREAFAKVRADLGEDAIILKNRAVPEGVEILAMVDEPEPVEQMPAEPMSARADARMSARARPAQPGSPAAQRSRTPIDDDEGQDDDTMSTVNFEAYVRERRQRRRELAADEPMDEPARRGPRPASGDGITLAGALGARPARDPFPTIAPARRTPPAAARLPELAIEAQDPASKAASGRVRMPEASPPSDDPAGRPAPARDRSLPSSPAVAAPSSRAAPASLRSPEPALEDNAGAVMSELREMRGFLSDRLESMSWFEGVRRRPAQSRMLRLLLKAGFSAVLSRKLADHLPVDFNDAESDQWLRAALRRNLRVETPGQTIFDGGGVFALLGPTGVGKTTTAAKIGAQFALKHGADSVGLITADVYRIGAQDQLRTFGRLLGVPVHVAHDVATLADILQLFANKKLVLIDTAGVGQRDTRVHDLLAALSSAEVRKVVVLNAAVQAEAIDEVIEAYQADQGAGVVLSKIDEAVQLGGVLDCVIRHRLPLQGIANGQRVPEDWHRPDAGWLVDRAMAAASSPRQTPFCFDEAELAMLLTAGAGAWAAPVAATRVRGV